jgi:hypothetical protein
MDQFPPLVTRAQAAAREAGFPLTREEAGPGRPSACLPGVGRFLAVLAAGCAGGIKRGFFTSEPRLTWTEVVLPDLRNSLLVGTRTK